MNREMTCINCPLGCDLTVQCIGKENFQVRGNRCKRGEVYAKKEMTDPRRTVCSTVRLEGSPYPRVSCKTKTDIPKGKIFQCMAEINGITVRTPVHIGDVLLENIAGTGVDLVATQERI